MCKISHSKGRSSVEAKEFDEGMKLLVEALQGTRNNLDEVLAALSLRNPEEATEAEKRLFVQSVLPLVQSGIKLSQSCRVMTAALRVRGETEAELAIDAMRLFMDRVRKSAQ